MPGLRAVSFELGGARENSRQSYREICEEAECERADTSNDRGCSDEISSDAYWYV
jgi:hypothetical protein